MDGVRREGREANGDVLSAILTRGAVSDPLSGFGEDGLAGRNHHLAAFVLHLQGSPQHDGVFVEFRPLARLHPSARRAHMGDGKAGGTCIDPADVFINQLGFVTGGGDSGGLGNELGHRLIRRQTTSS